MKTSVMMAVALAGVLAIAASPARASCNACATQTKVPSPAAPGKFLYRITCIDDASGDEVTSNITAATDAEAMAAAKARCD